MTGHKTQTDTRLDVLRGWLAARFGDERYSLAPASADASFRRYFRITRGAETWIAMDAPPPQEDCRPFVRIAGMLRAAGVHVPQVIAQDLERGFLLLSDLGTRTYLDILEPSNADGLFRDAIDALIKWQLASQPGMLPAYDEALLRREMNLYPEWYVARHLGRELTAAQHQVLLGAMSTLAAAALAQPSVYVHRDYMPRNLMHSTPNPGVLDFQDAVYGPITYDVVSLFRDAFISWPEEQVLDWTIRYWEKAKAARLPVSADFGAFWRDFEWMGMQRHLKVLGIFARIHHRDGKPQYLKDAPRFVAYVRSAAARYREFAALLKLVDELENVEVRSGYTF